MNHTGNKNIEHKPKQYNDSKHHDSQGSCNICAIQLLYWAPQTYRTRRNTIVILGTTLAQHNKAGYTATLVACGWAGAVMEKVTGAFGKERYAQKAKKRRKSNSRKSVRWSAVPDAPRLGMWG